MLAHLLNNAAVLVLTACGADLGKMAAGWNIALLVCSALCLAGTLAYLAFFDKSNGQKGGVKDGKHFFFAAAVGIAVCAVQWVAVLVSGFLGG